jgi:hypothetical protein
MSGVLQWEKKERNACEVGSNQFMLDKCQISMSDFDVNNRIQNNENKYSNVQALYSKKRKKYIRPKLVSNQFILYNCQISM